MIIMSKIVKRLRKILPNIENTILLGTAFGHLDEITESFNTVFCIASKNSSIKKRNIIYKENFDRIEHIPEIGCVFIDRDRILDLPNLVPILTKLRLVIMIEGNEVIGREFSKNLYDTGYRAVEQFKNYHVWEKIK